MKHVAIGFFHFCIIESFSDLFQEAEIHADIFSLNNEAILHPSIYELGDLPYNTSEKWLGGWGRKMAIFANVQYWVHADIVGGSDRAKNILM